ncbi:MAG TPA: hypothetical protein VF761_04880 [Gemmatimonadaceae bacterium]
MGDNLADITARLVDELHDAIDGNDSTESLDDALCAYVAYWRRMGASSTSIVAFTQRLIDRARTQGGGAAATTAGESEAVVAEVLARCFALASKPRR